VSEDTSVVSSSTRSTKRECFICRLDLDAVSSTALFLFVLSHELLDGRVRMRSGVASFDLRAEDQIQRRFSQERPKMRCEGQCCCVSITSLSFRDVFVFIVRASVSCC
jgi:hypothetical protein